MKISTASKKVLASALSAAMVVAFAPTVAFGAAIGGALTPLPTARIDANGGTLPATGVAVKLQANASTTATAVTISGLDTAVPTKAGYTFTGWEFDGDGAGSNLAQTIGTDASYVLLYANAETIDDTAATLKAIWTANSGISAETDTSKWTEADWVANGAVAKSSTVASTGITTKYFLKGEFGGSEAAALNEALAQGGSVVLLKDVNGNVQSGSTAVTFDLNGHTLTNDDIASTTGTDERNTAVFTMGAGDVTIKNGTVTPVQKANKSYSNAIATGAGKLTIESGTYNGVVAADITAIKGGTFNGAVDDGDTGLKLAGGTFEVSTSKDNTFTDTHGLLSWSNAMDAVAISTSGTVDVTGTVSVKATASGKNAAAYGIKGNVAVEVGDKGALTVEAASNGAQTIGYCTSYNGTTDTDTLSGDAGAYGIQGTLKNAGKGSAAVTAAAKDIDARAKAVTGTMSGAADLTATVAGDSEDTNAVVFTGTALADATSGAHINGGSYVGTLAGTVSNLAAGSFTDKITKGMLLDADDFGIIDNGKTYTVYTKALAPSYEGKLTLTTDEKDVVEAGISDAFDAIANGESAPVAYAGEFKASDVQAALKSGKVGAVVTYDAYNAKTATEAQAADFAAIEAMAKEKKSVVSPTAAQIFSIEITNGKSGSEKVVYGYVTNLGKGDRGKDRTITVGFAGISYADSDGYAFAIASNGKTADVTAEADSKTKTYEYKVNGTGIIAPYALSLAAIEDAAEKGEQAATEKATQGIDVAQKSKTVKLSGAKKTKKAVTFAIGASAETGLTIAKKSGSSRITVKGQKVTLKKGTKKGAFTAKVSIKAAASDEYLAAAKTITVKFVVKK